MPGFLALCEQTDVACLLLERLDPQSLASLGSCCHALQELVDRQPEELWERAAQLAGFCSSHPVQQAATVRVGLRQMHALHGSLMSARYHRTNLQLPRGRIAPDVTKHAALFQFDSEAYLDIRAVPSGSAQHFWDLPGDLEYVDCDARYHWSQDSATLALEYGEESWAHPPAGWLLSQGSLVPGCAGGAWGCYVVDANSVAGLVFVDTATGMTQVVDLPSQEQRVEEDRAHASVLGWSARGLLAVEHDDEDGSPTFSIFDAKGNEFASRAVDAASRNATWSPDGSLLLLSGAGSMWLWDVQAGSTQRVQGSMGAHAWSPCSGYAASTPRQGSIKLLDIAAHTISQHEVPEGCERAVWGHLGLVMLHSVLDTSATQPMWRTHLNVFQVSGQQLVCTLATEVAQDTVRAFYFPCLTQDGRHCVMEGKVLVDRPGAPPGSGKMQGEYKLAVVDCATGSTCELWTEATPDWISVQFSPDGERMLLTAQPVWPDTSTRPIWHALVDFS